MRRVQIEPKTELKVKGIVGYYIKKVTKYGTGAKIDCPKEHLGKTAYIAIQKTKK